MPLCMPCEAHVHVSDMYTDKKHMAVNILPARSIGSICMLALLSCVRNKMALASQFIHR